MTALQQSTWRVPEAVSNGFTRQRCSTLDWRATHTLQHCSNARSRSRIRAETQQTSTPDDLEAQMEQFLKRQQEQESGQVLAESQLAEEQGPVGTSEIPEEDAKRMCREIVKIARVLATKRGMGLNELKLTVAVEDPRVKERRSMGIEEGDYGCSRDEMAAALVDVSEGRIPKDRIALRALYTDLKEWPFVGAEAELNEEGSSANYSGITNTGVQGAKPNYPRKLGRDPNEKPKSLTDMLPDWVGYGALYAVSVVPIFIGVGVIAILFFNSLR